MSEIVKKYSLTKALYYLFLDKLEEFTNNPDQEFNLSELFVSARESDGLTQEQLAEKVGTSPLTLNEVETANCIVSFNELQTYF